MVTKRNNPATGFRIVGKWSVVSQRLRKKFPQLTEDDLVLEEGGEMELVKRLEATLNKTKEEIIQLIKKAQFASR
jgi:hypothetical protein